MRSANLNVSLERRVALLIVGVAVLIAIPVAGQAPVAGATDVSAASVETAPAVQHPGEPEWGTGAGISYWLPAAAFVPRDTGSVWRDAGFGRLVLVSLGGGPYPKDLMAPLNLPQGAHLTKVQFYWCDNDYGYDITGYLLSYPEANFAGSTTIASVSTGGVPACTGSIFAATDVTIDNNNNQYNVVVRFDGASSDLDFRGARLVYNLQLSPAPATATFGDVPTGYWAFQHIEALAASGITAGCGGGNFCPETTVTRAQMAVFLAKAFGLHWPG
jgi:hypothetical protein